MLKNPYIKVLRIRQYPKNFFIFAAILFDGQLFHKQAFLITFLGFVLLCLLSSGIYIFNDIIDIKSDQNHPRKKYRPIASGAISQSKAIIYSTCLVLISLLFSRLLSQKFFYICLIMLVINVFYSLKLKHLPIIDVMTIGILFLLRVASGAAIVKVKMFSPWLYIDTFMLSLFLGFGKRRAELAMITVNPHEVRPVLDGYSLPLLDQLNTIVASVTIMAYTLYTFFGPTLPSGNKMMITIPFVIYGIFRYMYLIQIKHEGGAPEEVLLSDHVLQADILIFGLSAIWAIYF